MSQKGKLNADHRFLVLQTLVIPQIFETADESRESRRLPGTHSQDRERRIQVTIIFFHGQKNLYGTNGLATGKQRSAIHPSNLSMTFPTQNFMTLNEQLVALLNNIDRPAQPLGNTEL